ncbi:MAG: hypothetical protein WCP91_03995 [Candidatus Berkelbacteria bacterium]
MSKGFWKKTIGWGALLWLIGWALGIIFIMVKIPQSVVGWYIMPIGIIITLWVLIKKIDFAAYSEWIYMGIIWAVIAIVLDYFLLVKLFNPTDGYYKIDVYLYYIITFVLPLIVGWWKQTKAINN